ncbi:MAG: formate/nitrite transporter family protein [Sutterella wadsworthensis]
MTDNSALRPDALTPKEITEKVLGLGVTKSSMDLRTQLPLTVLAGFYIGLGGLFCTLFMSDSTLPFAVQKFMGGAVFSLGLYLVLVAGAELYTGNTMLAGAAVDGRISWGAAVMNWVRVWLGNFVGALALVTLVYFAHVADTGPMAKGMMSIAVGKLSADWTTIMIKGILQPARVPRRLGGLCGRCVVDKAVGVVLPVSAFVALGFEHCVANMYFLPLAFVLKLSGYAPEGVPLDVITIENIVKNLSAATVGNTIAGVVLVLMYWAAFRKRA